MKFCILGTGILCYNVTSPDGRTARDSLRCAYYQYLRRHQEMDIYLKSCLLQATMEITAYGEVDLSKSGHDIFFDLLASYKGKEYTKDKATSVGYQTHRYDVRSEVWDHRRQVCQ